ncbi:hypothetical protein IK110_01455 [Candidatus Saccharibacteria bacterium]|nr:hypothetical protein [Candidatus Saccharibacteria bacterium]
MEAAKKDHRGKQQEGEREVRHTYDRANSYHVISVDRKAQNDRFKDYSTSSGD